MLFKPAIIICILFTFTYYGIQNVRTTTDTIISSLLPVSIIKGHGFDVKKISPLAEKLVPAKKSANGLPYYLIEKNGHQISTFPIFSSLIAVPIYVIPVYVNNITLENLEEHKTLIIQLSKLSSSLLSAVSVSFVYLSLTQILSIKKSLILTAIYALGTSTFSISSQALWQHAASQMFLAATIFFFIKGQKQKHMLQYCGLTLGLATLSRFPNLIIALLFLVYILFFERKSLPGFVKFTIPALIFFFWYQVTYPGELFFYKYEALGEIAKFNNSIIEGFTGLLFAPNKGLFIYSPIFLLTVWGIFLSWIQKNKSFIFLSFVILCYMTFLARWNVWHGSWSYGPRMLSDLTPFLTILIVPVIKSIKIWDSPKFKIFFAIISIFSMFVHFLGASIADFSWYSLQTIFLTEDQAINSNLVWNWHYPEIYYFYLSTGGFFGVISLVVKEFLNTTHILFKGSVAIILSYLLLTNLKMTVSKIFLGIKNTFLAKKKEYN